MKKYKVSDLKKILDARQISPEDLSLEVPISNMTIRRWVSKEDSFVIPEKYQIHMQKLALGIHNKTTSENMNFNNMEKDLLDAGKKELDNKSFLKSVKIKLSGLKSIRKSLHQVSELTDFIHARHESKIRLIALGALVYFVNPFDLIPDHLGLVGYMDDIGVMTFALTKIKELQK